MKREQAKESERMRDERIKGTSNGQTLRTRRIESKTRYSRKIKHKGNNE